MSIHVTLQWLPSHQRIEGNENVNKIAKDATHMPFIEPDPCCRLQNIPCDLGLLVEIMRGYTAMTYHLYKLGIIEDHICHL